MESWFETIWVQNYTIILAKKDEKIGRREGQVVFLTNIRDVPQNGHTGRHTCHCHIL